MPAVRQHDLRAEQAITEAARSWSWTLAGPPVAGVADPNVGAAVASVVFLTVAGSAR